MQIKFVNKTGVTVLMALDTTIVSNYRYKL